VCGAHTQRVFGPAQLIVALLLINAGIGYYEDQNAGDAVAALKSQLAPKSKVRHPHHHAVVLVCGPVYSPPHPPPYMCARARAQVLRGGEFKSIPAAQLVPGDIIRIKIGDVIPADVKVRGARPAWAPAH
jgi:H+-transporting ATPase